MYDSRELAEHEAARLRADPMNKSVRIERRTVSRWEPLETAMNSPRTSSDCPDFRAEVYGIGEAEEPPFWISVKDPDDRARSEVEALSILRTWADDPEDGEWAGSVVQMYVMPDGYGGLRVSLESSDDSHGPYDFWKFEEREAHG